jgi:hypothetical protein
MKTQKQAYQWESKIKKRFWSGQIGAKTTKTK